MVGFDLEGLDDGQEDCNFGLRAEEEPAMPRNMECDSDGGEDGERARLWSKPPAPSKAEWERHVVSHMPLGDWCRHCVAGKASRANDQFPPVCIDCCYLSGDATPMLVAKLTVERKEAADPRAVEKLAVWVDVLVTMRRDGEPAVMQVATAVRNARGAGSVTASETSAPGDHAGNGLAERAVGLVDGMVRTLKNELEFNCQVQIPSESKTFAWTIGHATTNAEPGYGWVRYKGTFRTVSRSRTPHGQVLVRRTSVVSSGSIDRSNEGRRQDGICHFRWLLAEFQRVHFDLRMAER